MNMFKAKKERGLTTTQIAKTLKIDPKDYDFYEKNPEETPGKIVRKLARLWNVSADYLLDLIDEENSIGGIKEIEVQIYSTLQCPRCRKELIIKHRSSDGHPFYGHQNFDRCDYTINIL